MSERQNTDAVIASMPECERWEMAPNFTDALTVYNRIYKALMRSELGVREIIEYVTEGAVELARADFGGYFVNVGEPGREEWSLYALTGANRHDFTRLGNPRITPFFMPTYQGLNVVRSDDIYADRRYGALGGLPPGHLPLRSYLAVTVPKRDGTVQGALLFGHKNVGAFTSHTETLMESIAGLAAVAIDNAERVSRASTAERMANEARLLLRSVIDSANDLFFVKDLNGRFIVVNETLNEMFGVDLIGKTDYDICAFEEATIFEANDRRVIETGEALVVEELLTVRGTQTIYQSSKMPWYDDDDNIIGIVGISRDFTYVKKARDTERLLRGELNHRVKNTLATIQSMAVATVRNAATPAEFKESFLGRIQAMAATHDILTAANWASASFQSIIRAELIPYHCEACGRWGMTGVDLLLNPAASTNLGMIVHELTTNAIKYGALAERGHIEIRWSLEDDRFILNWFETDGPPVAAPSRQGFGTRLLTSIAKSMGGSVRFDYDPIGFRCTFEVPAHEIVTRASQPDYLVGL